MANDIFKYASKLEIFTLFNLLHAWNASTPTDITDDGIFVNLRLTHDSKAFAPIVWSPAPKVIIVGLLSRILVVLFGAYRSVNQVSYINYNETSSINYKVGLVNNDLYEEDELGEDYAYVTSLIKDITADINYKVAVEAENDETDFLTNARQQEALQNAKSALSNAIISAQNEVEQDFIAIDVKSALMHLGEITGDDVTQEIINNIFETFCIGK